MLNVFSIVHSAPPSLFIRGKTLFDRFLSLVLYFDRIPIWGNFIITISVGMIVALGVLFIVKPRLKHSIEGKRRFQKNRKENLFFSLKKH